MMTIKDIKVFYNNKEYTLDELIFKLSFLEKEKEELQNELLALRKEKELLKNNLKLSEELRQYSSENKILELRGEIKYLKEKNSSLENELAIQTELNVNLCRHIIEINEK